MADKELFDDEELTSEFEDIVAPPKKRSKIKWLFFILVFLVLAVAALIGLNRMGYVDLPVNDYLPLNQLFQRSANPITVEPEIIALEPLPPIAPLPKKEQTDKTADKSKSNLMREGHYLQVGSCLYQTCIQEITNLLKTYKLNVIKKDTEQYTTYYELISEASYTKLRAEEKLRLLNRYNETIGFPYLLRTKKGEYLVSYGQFPNKATAIQLKSQMEHLFPQVRMRFLIRPKRDSATVTKLYVGPYGRSAAEKIRTLLSNRPEFERVEIIKFPEKK